jgi:hypothetical protein
MNLLKSAKKKKKIFFLQGRRRGFGDFAVD